MLKIQVMMPPEMGLNQPIVRKRKTDSLAKDIKDNPL